MTWATEADVVTITGSPADSQKLAQAQGMIELAVGRTETLATAELNTRDLEWLKRAVAYQAAWLAGQHDIHTRLSVTQLAQDGMAATFGEDSLTLAPLAKRAIGNLSWMTAGTRSVTVEPFCPTPVRRYPIGGQVIDYALEPWQALGPYSRRRFRRG